VESAKERTAAASVPVTMPRLVTTLRRTLPRPWRCSACDSVIRIGAEVAVHIEAGAPPNRVYHLACEPRFGGSPNRKAAAARRE